jgi:hypothetical protein
MCSATALLAFAACVLGQQGAAEKPAPEAAFQVAAGGDSVVLLETRSGKTWLLSKGDLPVWVPLHRFETEDEAARWRAEQRAAAHEAQIRKRFVPERAERLIREQRERTAN